MAAWGWPLPEKSKARVAKDVLVLCPTGGYEEFGKFPGYIFLLLSILIWKWQRQTKTCEQVSCKDIRSREWGDLSQGDEICPVAETKCSRAWFRAHPDRMQDNCKGNVIIALNFSRKIELLEPCTPQGLVHPIAIVSWACAVELKVAIQKGRTPSAAQFQTNSTK